MSKTEAELYRKLEIWWLLSDIGNPELTKKDIRWGHKGENGSIRAEICLSKKENYVRLVYTIIRASSGEKKDIDYKIPITTTPCNFGGSRHWYECPMNKNGRYCGRRVGVLYQVNDYFMCRHCGNLTYLSQKMSNKSRNHPSMKITKLEHQLEDSYMRAKRYTYRGKPTKMRRKIQELDVRLNYYNQ